MNAFRQIINNTNGYLHIQLPKDFQASQVEVIMLPLEEKASSKKMDISSLYGCLNTGLSQDKIDKKIKALRNEWENLK